MHTFLQLPQRRGEKAVHKAEGCQRLTLPYQAWEASESYPEQLVVWTADAVTDTAPPAKS